MNNPSPLTKLSLIVRSSGEAPISQAHLLRWFEFLGGKPIEVILIDNGSSLETQADYWQLFHQKLIDKLQLCQSAYKDSAQAQPHIQRYTEGAIAWKPYLLWIDAQAIPQRQGQDNWLADAIDTLNRNGVMAITAAVDPSKQRDVQEGWYYSDECNFNFTLIKRDTFIAAMHEYADDYITFGFTGENPAMAEATDQDLVKTALDHYSKHHRQAVLCKQTDPNWCINPKPVFESIV